MTKMISSLSAWDKEKFKEYLTKTNQYTNYSSMPTEYKALNNNINGTIASKEQFPVDGISVVDNTDYSSKLKTNQTKFTKIYNNGDTFNQTDVNSIKNAFCSHKNARNPEIKSDNVEPNANDDNLINLDKGNQETNAQDSNNLTKENFNNSKSTQTNKIVENFSQFKRLHRANQTVAIKTRNASISTDSAMTKSWMEDYVKINKFTVQKILSRTESSQSKQESVQNTAKILSQNPLKHSTNHSTNVTVSIQTPSDENEKKFPNHIDNHQSEITDNQSCNSISNIDEMTIVSKPLSKYPSINDILENFGRSVVNNTVKHNSNSSSFWDNPLLDNHLENDNISMSLKPLHQNSYSSNKQSLTKSTGDTMLNQKSEYVKSNFSAKSHKYDTSINTQHKEVLKNKGKVHISFDDFNLKKTAVKSKAKSMNTKSVSYAAPISSNSTSNTFSSGSISNNQTNMNFTRTFYLNPYDDLVKSHLNFSDRRLKSVGAKNQSEIIIDGPLTKINETNCKILSQTQQTILYKCIIRSKCKDNLEKCINYLKETFPQSYLQSRCKKSTSQ